MDGYFMYRLSWPNAKPSIDEIRSKFGIAEEDIDASFGVVPLDGESYAILISATAYAKIEGGGILDGPYSNPRIDHFGMEQE